MDRRKTAAAAANSSSQTSRKRRRKLSNQDVYEAAETTAVAGLDDVQSTSSEDIVYSRELNVIDRCLDSARYPVDSSFSLYELCRDWIYAGTTLAETIRLNDNLSHERSKIAAAAAAVSNLDDSPNDESKSTSDDVYKLPDPKPDEDEDINIEIKELNRKLDETVRQRQANDLEIVKSLNVDDQVFQSNALLKLHVDRWKTTRREWLHLYNRSNSRYKDSEDLLKSIFEELQ